ncbi:hypothetical protein HAX54_028211 [Datura stramonium]|uniref:Uncharacterized protein n=1 Tax=Datura stramonium TaxID=4076 RepID=A0ABS8V5Z8_DATST|nr:hypothetical protein [Datura stramonium]
MTICETANLHLGYPGRTFEAWTWIYKISKKTTQLTQLQATAWLEGHHLGPGSNRQSRGKHQAMLKKGQVFKKRNFGKDLLNPVEKVRSHKGKEIMVSDDQNEESERRVERDVFQLNEKRGNFSIREAENEETEAEIRGEKANIETSLSLALPNVSLFLASSNRVQDGDHPSQAIA